MSTSYSTNLALALPATGELSGTWGTTVNTNITNMLDEALGYQAYSATGGADTITIPDGTTGVARSIYIQLNGTGGGSVAVPTTKTKMYFVFNNTSSAITFKVTGQTGVSIPAAAKMALVSNGTDVIVAQNYFAALTLGAALPVLSGGTGVTTSTGTGSVVLNTSPTLVTPALGTPSSGTVTNLTGTASININGTVGATTANTGAFTTLSASGLSTFSTSIRAVGVTDTALTGAANQAGFMLVSSGDYMGMRSNTNHDLIIEAFQKSEALKIANATGLVTMGYGAAVTGTLSTTSAITATSVPAGPMADLKLYGNNSNNNTDQSSIRFYDQGANNTARITAQRGANGNEGNLQSYVLTGGVETKITELTGTGLAVTGTLSATGGVTLSGGTANGVAYLNGSKVLTTGSALTFDGTVVNNTGVVPEFRSTVTGGASYTKLATDGIYATGTDLYLLAPASKVISFYANNAEQMRLTSTGLGIGTATPNAKLSVNTTTFTAATNTAQVAIENTEAWSQGLAFYIWGAGSYNSGYASGYIGAPNSTSQLYISGGAAVVANTGSGGWAKALNTTSASFTVVGAGSTIFYGDTGLTANTAYTPTERMRLDSSGNLGIGTSLPTTKLTVSGSSAIITVDGTTSTGARGVDFVYSSQSYGSLLNYAQTGETALTAGYTGSSGYFLTFKTENVERVRITNAGNLGIGTSSPSTKLTVYDATTPQVTFNNGTSTFIVGNTSGGNNHILYGTGAYPMIFYTNAVEGMRLDASGNLGLGVTPSAWATVVPVLQVANASFSGYNNQALVGSNFYYNAGNKYIANGYATLYSQSLGQHIWYNAPNNTSGAGAAATFTQAMTLDASGKLFLGTTTTPTGTGSGRFNVEPGNQNGIAIGVVTTGNTGLDINVDSASAYIAYFRYNNANVGSITTNGTITVYNTTSDYRLKTVSGAVSGQGSRIDALQPVEYTWNSNGIRTRGFLAHQFQEVYPSSVSGTKDAMDADGKPVYQAMQASTSEVIADLVAELQSLRARVAQLESKP